LAAIVIVAASAMTIRRLIVRATAVRPGEL
jgi:hypothetical protein